MSKYNETHMMHTQKSLDEFDRDTAYWNQYYASGKSSLEPTLFARAVLPLIKTGGYLVDLGCGNGRDSLFFFRNGLLVLGIDASSVAIERLNREITDDRIKFRCCDFTCIQLDNASVDYCYSRFTLHAITQEQENDMLTNAERVLKPGGQLFIEARSVNDTLYGLGQAVGRNAFIYNDHYRRFIVKEELEEQLKKKEFSVISIEESVEFAPFGDEKPSIIRAIAEK